MTLLAGSPIAAADLPACLDGAVPGIWARLCAEARGAISRGQGDNEALAVMADALGTLVVDKAEWPNWRAALCAPAVVQSYPSEATLAGLVPRLPEDTVNEDLAHFLANLLPQICLVFGWQLGKVEFKPDYMLWTAQVLPAEVKVCE